MSSITSSRGENGLMRIATVIELDFSSQTPLPFITCHTSPRRLAWDSPSVLSSMHFQSPHWHGPSIFTYGIWSSDYDVFGLRIATQLHWEPVIVAEGVPPPYFVRNALRRGIFFHFAIKAAALTFKTRYGDGVDPQNRQMKNLRPWMGLSPPAKNSS